MLIAQAIIWMAALNFGITVFLVIHGSSPGDWANQQPDRETRAAAMVLLYLIAPFYVIYCMLAVLWLALRQLILVPKGMWSLARGFIRLIPLKRNNLPRAKVHKV